jgi:RNA polymerase sigma-70 factor, ECF subfamily
MSGDSLPIALPFSGFASEAREVTVLYREVHRPLLRISGVSWRLDRRSAGRRPQDVFLALHRHLASGGSQANIRSWLFRVAHNEARNRQNRYDRRFGTPLDEEIDPMLDESTPERAVLQKEKFQRLGKAIRQLAQSERECLLLHASGLRYREIGEVLGIATSTVGDTVDRAIKKLAEKCNV